MAPFTTDDLADLGMGRRRADDQVVAVHLDALELGDARDVDQVRRRRQPLFHRRQQRMAARQDLAVGCRGNGLDRVGDAARPVVIEVMHDVLPYSAAFF